MCMFIENESRSKFEVCMKGDYKGTLAINFMLSISCTIIYIHKVSHVAAFLDTTSYIQ